MSSLKKTNYINTGQARLKGGSRFQSGLIISGSFLDLSLFFDFFLALPTLPLSGV